MMLSGRYLAPAYSTGLNAAAALAYAAGVEPEDIARSLSSFRGVPGRGEVEKQDGKIVIRERNPGVTARSIDWNLKILEEYYQVDDMALVVDPLNAKVCEKLDVDDIAKKAKQRTSVKGAYLVDHGHGKPLPEPFVGISTLQDISSSYAVLLLCTKEGYL
jgi:UDP-N-acetylmuramyl pentapeptide synthase